MTDSTKTNDATTVSLQYPTEFAGEAVSTLTIKARPIVADLKRMDSVPGEVAKTCRLISSLCSVPMALVEALHPADYLAINEVCNELMGKRPATGKTS